MENNNNNRKIVMYAPARGTIKELHGLYSITPNDVRNV